MNYLFLLVLWITLTFQLFMDENRDGLRQPDEPGAASVAYTITWQDGDLSAVQIGTSMSDGTILTDGQGTVTLQAACASYSAPMAEVVGQGTINLPCVWSVYLPGMAGR